MQIFKLNYHDVETYGIHIRNYNFMGMSLLGNQVKTDKPIYMQLFWEGDS